eukprot:1854783-Pyramimonas_sp.AAC.1
MHRQSCRPLVQPVGREKLASPETCTPTSQTDGEARAGLFPSQWHSDSSAKIVTSHLIKNMR